MLKFYALAPDVVGVKGLLAVLIIVTTAAGISGARPNGRQIEQTIEKRV